MCSNKEHNPIRGQSAHCCSRGSQSIKDSLQFRFLRLDPTFWGGGGAECLSVPLPSRAAITRLRQPAKKALDVGKANLGGRPDKKVSKKGLFAIIVHRRLCLGGFPSELENSYGCFQHVRFASASQWEQNATNISREESWCVCGSGCRTLASLFSPFSLFFQPL